MAGSCDIWNKEDIFEGPDSKGLSLLEENRRNFGVIVAWDLEDCTFRDFLTVGLDRMTLDGARLSAQEHNRQASRL
jgi:hypothetical protein